MRNAYFVHLRVNTVCEQRKHNSSKVRVAHALLLAFSREAPTAAAHVAPVGENGQRVVIGQNERCDCLERLLGLLELGSTAFAAISLRKGSSLVPSLEPVTWRNIGASGAAFRGTTTTRSCFHAVSCHCWEVTV